MKEKFTDWTPTPDRMARLGQIAKVLAQYAKMGIKLTLRQLFYQLVTKNIIANTQREYKKLGDLLSRARLAGLIDWNIIEDRVRRPVKPLEFGTIQDRIDLAVENFRLKRWTDQPEYVELWVEKDALSSVIEPICDDLHVTMMVNRGYSSSSAMYEASKRIERERGDREATIIYLGDFDPSGEDMVRDIQDRLTTFESIVSVTKLALNRDQIDRYKLPPNPAKMTDSRASAFVAEHGVESFEVDALPPEVLQEMIRESIENRMDMDAYQAVMDEEEELKKKLVELGRGL